MLSKVSKRKITLISLAIVVIACFLLAGKVFPLYRVFPTLEQVTPLPSKSKFTTLPPGTKLPSEAECASRVHRSPWEPRPDNYKANHTVPTAHQLAGLIQWIPDIGVDAKSDTIRKQITGNFTGTTDEILQWVACKWGIDENIVRAEAVIESYWHQSDLGDWTTDRRLCPPGVWNGKGCNQSYGILQIKYSDYPGTWPMSRDDTAFNAEFSYGWIRNCYEGWADYLYQQTKSYHAGDIWGCVGFWYTGNWYDQGAIGYINQVKDALTNKVWQEWTF